MALVLKKKKNSLLFYVSLHLNTIDHVWKNEGKIPSVHRRLIKDLFVKNIH